jgi:single-stranded-DNA-specific exonuclease
MKKLWTLRPADDARVKALARALGLPVLAARLLVGRGLEDPEAAGAFLEPRLDSLPDPLGLKGMPEAVKVVADAIEAGETVAVLGDYDADGVTSTAQVLLFLRALNHPSAWSIPHRVREGYGLSKTSVARFLDQGVRVFVTVDTGVAERKTIASMKERGARVVVLDHHAIAADLPPADAVVNPLQEGDSFPFKDMAACGLAFYFLSALRRGLMERGFFERKGLPAPDMREYLDLVALGTIADVVGLTGVNRVLARHGLMRLRQKARPGTRCLIDAARMQDKLLDEGHVSFYLAPRINAGGRVDVADTALHLLLAEDLAEAARLAKKLNELNTTRQGLERRAYDEALAQIEGDPTRHLSGGGIVVAGESWHVGVVGITASKLSERYGRPTLVLGRDGDDWRGSGRSVEGFDLAACLEQGRHLLKGCGGHAFAVGLSVGGEQLEEFSQWFRTYTAERLGTEPRVARGELDAEVRLADVLEPRFVEAYKRLWPFGEGNRKPVFLARGVQVVKLLTDGGSWARYRVAQGGVETSLAFLNAGVERPPVSSTCDLVFGLDLSTYRGIETTGLIAVDTALQGEKDASDA